MLSKRFTPAELLRLAAEVDAGFDVAVFADMVAILGRYSDVDLDVGQVDFAALRRFFGELLDRLRDTH
jgi:hypothetical protein